MVAQMVEHEETGLGKGLNSNTNHLGSALSRVRVPSRQQPFGFSGVKEEEAK